MTPESRIGFWKVELLEDLHLPKKHPIFPLFDLDSRQRQHQMTDTTAGLMTGR